MSDISPNQNQGPEDNIDLEPKLEAALARAASTKVPKVKAGYWDTIDSSLVQVESDNTFDELTAALAGSSTTPRHPLEDSAPARETSTVKAMAEKKDSKLRKAMFGTAASIAMLGGGFFLYQGVAATDTSESANVAADNDESASDAGQSLDQSASNLDRRASGDDTSTDAADSFATEAGDEPSFAESVDKIAELADLNELDWYLELVSRKNLVSDEKLSFVASDFATADGLITDSEFVVYRVDTELDRDLRIVLASAGLDVTFSVYDPTGEVLASQEALIEFSASEAAEYYIVVESVGETDLEYELSVQQS